MALETIVSDVYLDVYNHDTSPTTIKTIALDSQTRIVRAYLQNEGLVYNPDATATVDLIAIRPDKVGVIASGEIVELVPAQIEDEEVIEPAIYGVQAEVTQAMIAVPGNVRFQFRLTVGTEIIRTEIFAANNGVALDGETTDWSGEYQGYNLDELVRKVDTIGLGGVRIEDNTLVITTIEEAASEYHTYVDTKLAEIRAELGAKVLTDNNRIEIRSREEGET